MKYATILAILSFAATKAAAHRYPENITTAYTDGEWEQIFKGGLGHCGGPGKPCHTAKRAALAVAEAISFPDPKGRVGFCGPRGMACMENGKRDADANPAAMARGRVGFCSVKGMPCMGARDALEKIGRVAEKTHHAIWAREAEAEAAAEAAPRGKNGFCSVKGMACMTTRDADPEPRHHKHKKPKKAHPKVGFCGPQGMPCMENGKRSALPEAEALADPEPKKHKAHPKMGFCGPQGMPCLENGKRSALPEAKALAEAGKKNGFCSVKGMACMAKRDADAAHHRGVPKGHKGTWCGADKKDCATRRIELEDRLPADKQTEFCGVPGSTCSEKREIDDFEELDLTSEEGETHTNYVREIVEGLQTLDPELDRRECYAEHGPCSDILKAKTAFESAKAHAHTHAHKHGVDSHTTEIAHAHLQVRDLPVAQEAEFSCYGPDGSCTAAKRAVDELETAINEAVALLN